MLHSNIAGKSNIPVIRNELIVCIVAARFSFPIKSYTVVYYTGIGRVASEMKVGLELVHILLQAYSSELSRYRFA